MPPPLDVESRIRGLDGVRGLAILLVLCAHLQLPPALFTRLAGKFFWPLDQGGLGVTLFFVLSGFVITRSLIRENERWGSYSLRAFYVRRVLRICIPLCVFLVGAFLVTRLRGLTLTIREIVEPLSFLVNYKPLFPPRSSDYSTLTHLWSLSVEEQFYLIWPALLLLGWRGGSRASLIIIVASPFVRVASFYLAPGSRDLIPFLTHTRADSLMWGAGAALVLQEPLVRRFLTGHKASPLGLACLVGAILLSPLIEARYFSKYLFTVGYSLQSLAFATLILVVALVPLSLIGRAFQFKPLVWLGQISYSLYLWQQLFLVPTPLHPRPFNTVIGLGVSILIALGSYLLVERPAIALGRRLTTRLRGESSREEPGVSRSIAA